MSEIHRTYRFSDGHLVKSDPPEWFAKAMAQNVPWPKQLTDAGAAGVENFGAGEIEIFQRPDGEYFIGIGDQNIRLAEVFIDNIADYLKFRASYIAPLAQLIMESERHAEWREANKLRAA